MKRNFLRRAMALTVALAMTVSSVPADFVFAEEEFVDAEETILPDEELPAAEAASEEDAAESVEIGDDFVAGIEAIAADEVPAEVADLAELAGNQAQTISVTSPYKVSDFRVDGENLRWHVDEEYPKYEFEVSDSKGNYYFAGLNAGSPVRMSLSDKAALYGGTTTDAAGNLVWTDYRYNGSVLISNIVGSAYKKNAAGAWEAVLKDPNDPSSQISGLQAGETYSISMCAVGDTGTQGGMAGPVPYTQKAEELVTTPGTPLNLRQVDDNISWDAPAVGAADVYYVIVKDANYRYGQGYLYDFYAPDKEKPYTFQDYEVHAEDYRHGGGSVSLSTLKSYISAYAAVEDGKYYSNEEKPGTAAEDKPFQAGRTYNVQVYAVNYGLNEKGETVRVKGTPTAVIQVTYTPNDLKPVTGLMLNDETLTWSFGEDNGASFCDVVVRAGAKEVGRISLNGTYTSIAMSEVASGIKDDKGVVTGFIPGQTYTISIQAGKYDNGEKVYAAESGSVTYTEEAQPGRNKAVTEATAVTGLVVREEADISKGKARLSSASILWNAVDGMESDDYYEIMVKDADGREYFKDCSVEFAANGARSLKGEYKAVYRASVSAADFAESYTYTLPDGVSLTKVVDAENEYLTGFDAGKTYTVCVRVVDTYKEYNAATGELDSKKVTGKWSAAGTYTVGSVEPITDLKWVPDTTGKKLDAYYFSYSAKRGTVYYQVSTDPNFKSNNTWSDKFGGTSDYKLRIEKTKFDQPGTTYYVRAVNVLGNETLTADEWAELMEQNPGMRAELKTDALPAAPKTITGLKVKKETPDAFELVFDNVLTEGIDYFELQYTDKTPSAAMEKEWLKYDYSVDGDGISFSKDRAEGAYYVRAVAYVYDRDGNEVYGTPSAPCGPLTIKKAVDDVALTGLAVKRNQTGYVFTYTNAFKNNENVRIQIADSAEFVKNGDKTWVTEGSFEDGEYSLAYSRLTPGKTYYARARVYNAEAEEGKQYGPWSDAITIAPQVVKLQSVSTRGVNSTTLILSMNKAYSYNEDYLSGYQVQRKSGKKWKTLAYTTDNEYKSGGLKSNTRYQYRVRPYYYDAATKKYYYGSYAYCEALTWGNALNLKVRAAGKTSAKLTWTKVTGASGYEIYRSLTNSETSEQNGNYSDAFSSMRLIKTIKKASTKSYTNKKLTSGMSYTYVVRAYKTINKKKYYISSNSVTVDLSMKSFAIKDKVYLSSGKMKVTWTPIYTANGYLIEKKNTTTGKWDTYATVSKAKTYTYTLPAATDNAGEGEEYRIRAYKGDEYSTARTVTVKPYLKAPTGVKAVAQEDGSIKVTWSKVTGADYYMVYRTTSSYNVYYEDRKSYSGSGAQVRYYVADETALSGYRKADDDELTGTELTDREISYTLASGVTNTLWAGPKTDVQYYYYVVAYKKGTEYIGGGNTVEDSIGAAVSDASQKATATVASLTVKTPTKVKAKASTGKVKLSWKKVSGVKGYVVYRSTKKSSGYVPIANITKSTTKSYTDSTVTKGKKYYYRVRAYKIGESGAYIYSKDSSAKSVKAK